jgi:hypothetical protein
MIRQDIFWNPNDPTDRKNLSRYVLEGLDEIALIFHRAKATVATLTKDPSFWGCVSGDRERVRLEVRAMYEQLQHELPKAGGTCLAYVLEPSTYGTAQRIRLANEVLFWGHGVCLDRVLVYAACLYHAHIYPLVLITSDHAILAYWLSESEAKACNQPTLEGKLAYKMTHQPSPQIRVVNVTRIPPAENGQWISFTDAEHEAETHLATVQFAVDVHACREAGIRPLFPKRHYQNDDASAFQHMSEQHRDINASWISARRSVLSRSFLGL